MNNRLTLQLTRRIPLTRISPLEFRVLCIFCPPGAHSIVSGCWVTNLREGYAMKRLNRSARTGVSRVWRRMSKPAGYEAVIDDLISEMARLVCLTDPRTFSPPFELVIIGNRGCVAFAGKVDHDGEMRASSPLRNL